MLKTALIDYYADHDIHEILALPDVKERVDLYFSRVGSKAHSAAS